MVLRKADSSLARGVEEKQVPAARETADWEGPSETSEMSPGTERAPETPREDKPQREHRGELTRF